MRRGRDSDADDRWPRAMVMRLRGVARTLVPTHCFPFFLSPPPSSSLPLLALNRVDCAAAGRAAGRENASRDAQRRRSSPLPWQNEQRGTEREKRVYERHTEPALISRCLATHHSTPLPSPHRRLASLCRRRPLLCRLLLRALALSVHISFFPSSFSHDGRAERIRAAPAVCTAR